MWLLLETSRLLPTTNFVANTHLVVARLIRPAGLRPEVPAGSSRCRRAAAKALQLQKPTTSCSPADREPATHPCGTGLVHTMRGMEHQFNNAQEEVQRHNTEPFPTKIHVAMRWSREKLKNTS